ncbi:MAG TPA: OmpA family protein [Gemmatimonadaceae bacterium]|nr:OmpA family protein [Gemmatimonadaceae bacterium]
MSTILDSLNSLASPAVSQIAGQLGETDAAVTHGLQSSFASVVAGIINKTEDPAAMDRVFELVNTRAVSADLGTDVQKMASGIAVGAPATAGATSLLAELFATPSDTVGQVIGQIAGLEKPASGSSLLDFAAALVLAFLGKKVRGESLRLGGLSNLLVAERGAVFAALPDGLEEFIGALPTRRVDPGPDERKAVVATPSVIESARPSAVSRIAWPLIGIAAVALTWFYATRGGVAEKPIVSIDTTVAQAGGEVVDAASGLVKRDLPGGVTLKIPASGIESKLIAFIGDNSRPVNDTTWFDFDRLNFASGSAAILPESKEQLDNIVAVLKAYPSVNVKVGGYTDDVGSADANLKLSQRRADAVMQAIVSSGIATNRLRAEGYGELHPVADNSTEPGRALNRRIALRVIKK